MRSSEFIALKTRSAMSRLLAATATAPQFAAVLAVAGVAILVSGNVSGLLLLLLAVLMGLSGALSIKPGIRLCREYMRK